MKKDILTKLNGFIVVSYLLTGASAYSETIKIPCGEYVQNTGIKMPCDVVPSIKMSSERYDQEKAAYEEKMSGGADIAPWNRTDAVKNNKNNSKTFDDCSMPPWKRSSKTKCE